MRALAIIGTILLAASTAAATTGPRVALADRSPVRIVGVGFKAHDRISVRVHPTVGPDFGRVVTAGQSGMFVARFQDRTLERCTGYVITASGTSGRRATHRELPPSCGMDP